MIIIDEVLVAEEISSELGVDYIEVKSLIDAYKLNLKNEVIKINEDTSKNKILIPNFCTIKSKEQKKHYEKNKSNG